MFWMEISAEAWEQCSPQQEKALIDHDLCHFGIDFSEEANEPMLVIIEHDVEEFTDIARRHGMWINHVQEFGAALLGFEGP